MTMLKAREIALALREERTTPGDVLETCLAAIAERDADVRAFCALDVAAARARAQGAAFPGTALAGLPFAVKDIIDTRDLPTAYGSPIFAGYRPRADAPVVGQALRAGGLLLGKTVTTEFAFLKPSETRNPRRLTHSPGGSSSGSAAAVAAGMVPFALGTQTGGSVVRPASYCGVTGYKPTYRLLPALGMKTFSWHLDTMGLFAAGVEDVAFAASALTGRDLSIERLGTAPRLGVLATARDASASADAHAALATAARAAAAAGARVVPITLPEELEAADAVHGTIQDFEAALALMDEFTHHRGQLSDGLRAHLEKASAITPEAYDEARRIGKRGRHVLGTLFGEVDALLTFSAPGTAPEGFSSTGSPMFNRLWTLMGCPTINIAGLTGADGLPMGVQLVGRFGRDRAALTLAALVERAIVG
ncbi:amidase [Xanthobacter pseudotagetidis]|uniref:amidase n=1 Tax=Xanthobacter pseudotagetidis TaxID=3119911 RepID=UPI00372630B1